MSGRSATSPPAPPPPPSEPVLEDGVAQQLAASGERERLKELLRDRLVDCGWREDVTRHAREFVAGAKGHKVTADDIVAAIRPRGRQRVPDHVKAELLTELRAAVVKS